jgi:two-component system sensor histidine kinase and response regulator WspE
MPVMDGLQLAREIKQDPQLSRLPVVLLTSMGGQHDRERGLASGADAYVVKSTLTREELLETIEQLL